LADSKGGGFLVVKGAAGLELASFLDEWDARVDHIDNVGAGE